MLLTSSSKLVHDKQQQCTDYVFNSYYSALMHFVF